MTDEEFLRGLEATIDIKPFLAHTDDLSFPADYVAHVNPLTWERLKEIGMSRSGLGELVYSGLDVELNKRAPENQVIIMLKEEGVNA